MVARAFTRTTNGKISQYKFHRNTLVWVEGTTDYPFFEPITRSMACSLRCAGGREECDKLAHAMIADDLPYVVIKDGDYGILDDETSRHRRYVVLARYSIENYCAEPQLVETVCRTCSNGALGGAELRDRFCRLLEEVERSLKALVIYDVAVQRNEDANKKVLPRNVMEILAQTTPSILDTGRIDAMRRDLDEALGLEFKEEAEELVGAFLSERRFVDVLKGHLVFGLVRWFILGELRRAGIKATLDNRVLRAWLGVELWQMKKSDDHITLREHVEAAVRDAGCTQARNQLTGQAG